MSTEWSSIAFATVILISVISVVLWWTPRIRLNPKVIVSALLAWVAFQSLFFMQGSIAFPAQNAPFEHKVLVTIALVLAFNAVLQLFKWFLIEVVPKHRQLNLPHFILDVFGWLAMVIVSLALVREVFDVELTGVLVTSTIVSAVIGLSLQEILGSIFAGLILQIESPFRINDWVQVAGEEGQIVGQNWRTLSILTLDNHYVILPNNKITQEQIINYSRPTPLQRQSVSVSVAYMHPPGEVEEVLCGAISGIDGVLRVPPPSAEVVKYGDSAIDYNIRYWIQDYQRKQDIEDVVMKRFWYALKRAKMQIPFPIRDLNIRLVSEQDEEQKEAEQRLKIAMILRSLLFLENLSDRQIQQLARSAELCRYTTGETLVEQGEKGDSLFIIKSGRVEIYVKGEDGNSVYVTRRVANEFFGEMSLLTGEPRSASVIAETETEVIIINKDAFVSVLMTDPSILELLLDALDQRRHQTTKKLADDANSRQQAQKERRALLSKITNFLGLATISLQVSKA